MTRLNEPFEHIPSPSTDDGIPQTAESSHGASSFEERWSPPNSWFLRIHPAAHESLPKRSAPSWSTLVLIAAAIILGILAYQTDSALPRSRSQPEIRSVAPIQEGTKQIRPTRLRDASSNSIKPEKRELNDEKKTLLMLFFQSLGKGRGLM